MSEQSVAYKQRRGARGITGALILIALGGAFLLANLGIVSFNWWALLRYWPVFLILVGLDLLLGRTALGSLAVALVGLAMLAGILYLVSQDDTVSGPRFVQLSGETVTREVSEALGDVSHLDSASFSIGAGTTNIETVSDSSNIVEGTYRTDRDLELSVDYRPSDGRLVVSQEEPQGFPADNYVGELDLALNNTVSYDNVQFDFGAGEFILDLTDLDVRSIVVNGGVGNIQIKLPEVGDYTVEVSAGVGNVGIDIPDDLEGQIVTDVALTSVDIPDRFEKQDNIYTTDGYDGAPDRATIHISTAIGNVEVH